MIKELLVRANEAVRSLSTLDDDRINEVLRAVACRLRQSEAEILRENFRDLERMSPDDPKYDRLKLTTDRLAGIADDMENVVTLPSPLGKTLAEWSRPNGMRLRKVSVPFGVIGVIYEARPNVTCDVFSLCLKSGNVCVLKGGSDADCSNRALVKVIHSVLSEMGVNPSVCLLLPPDREATAELLEAVGCQ